MTVWILFVKYVIFWLVQNIIELTKITNVERVKKNLHVRRT